MADPMDSHRLATIIRELRRFGPDSASTGHQLDQQITIARSIIHFLDQTFLLQRVARLDDQVLIVSQLQDLAYYEPDSGCVPDIAHWCVRQWLRLLQQYGEDVGVLQGLGQAWLLRSQTSLATIQLEEGSASSGTCSDEYWLSSDDSFDETVDFIHAATEANSQRHTADYVEARGTLIPATDYLTRAVNLAERQGILSGHLLSLAAESYMSFGNVSYAPANEQHFRQALIYLRQASQIPGYLLTPYLRRYLEEYGRLME